MLLMNCMKNIQKETEALTKKVITVESRFKKARFKKESQFKKESRFKKDCWYNRFFST